MELFVGNLPPEATPAELRSLFQRGVRLPVRFQCSAKVIRSRDRHGRTHCYGRIKISPERLARLGMLRPVGWQLHGRRILVREFHHRATGNERRAINWRVRHWGGPERRLSERRTFFPPVPVASEKAPQVPDSSPLLKMG